MYVLAKLRKAGEVRGQFHEYAVFLDGAHNAGYCFSGFKQGSVLLPGSEEFLVRQAYSSVIHRLDNNVDILPDRETILRVSYPRH